MYFRWTPWAPPLLQRLLTNSTFQVSYILVSIILSCLTNQGVALTMYILHIALFSKFASMNIPEMKRDLLMDYGIINIVIFFVII